jgi:hypothetical protein
MNEDLKCRCEQFIRNRDIVKLAIPWENAYFYPICASIFVDKNMDAGVEKLRECRKLLKSRLSVFSNFRGISELVIVSKLAADEDPEKRLGEAIRVYEKLKSHFFSSEYLPIGAMIISETVESYKYEEVCARTRRIYDLMKHEHPFLTSSEDSIFATMLALTPRSDEEIVREVEDCYGMLKESFLDKNAVQSLSHVLALSNDGMRTSQERCRDTVRLFEALKEKKYKYGTGYELATLGVLAALPCGIDEAVREIIEASDYLKEQKGYGFFGMGRSLRMLHAGMVVSSLHMGSSQAFGGVAFNSAVSLVAAQQAAVCAAIAASVAAANAARST